MIVLLHDMQIELGTIHDTTSNKKIADEKKRTVENE